MKKRRIVSLTLIILLIMATLPMGAPALAASVPSQWAIPEINEANVTDLLTTMAAKDFHSPLTRGDFCEIVVNMIEQTLGAPLPVPLTNPFVDDVYPIGIHVLKAWNYGIIQGYTPTRFSPELNLERQQLCKLMINAIRNLERDLRKTILSPGIAVLPYKDADKVQAYALDEVKVAYSNNIMIGNTAGYFLPEDTVVSEECVIAALRCFNRIEAVRTSGMANSQLLDLAARRVNIGYAYGDSEYGVTQNLLLPVTSTGGATVTWSSSNSTIIRISGGTGIVSSVSSPRDVTLTATIRFGNTTRTKDFTVTVSTYSGDRLLVENALSALEIVYTNDGDSADYVTGRVWLPVSVQGLSVTWQSSNTSAVSASGAVTLPTNSDVRTATLTATVRSGSQTRSKTFALTVVNPAFGRGVTLQGVWLGMTPAQVTQLLGTVRRTISASNTESWQIYRNTNYTNFVAVGFINSRAVAVYSMASGVSSQLRNNAGTVITIPQANAVPGVTAVSYTDPGSSSQQYAILISDSTSVIGGYRTVNADSQEQLLFEYVNAFRVRNSRSLLEWSDKLGAPARAHSANSGSGTLRTRVLNGGFDSARYAGGNFVAGGYDAFEALDQIVNNSTGSSAMRTEILQSAATLFGAGYSGSQSGNFRTYYTYALGAVTWITGFRATQQGVTGNVSTISTGIGASATAAVTLTMTPTGYNETFTVTSSNTAIMTVSNITTTNTGATVTVTGVATGSANLVVTGNSSGKSYTMPVAVATVYANRVALSWNNISLTSGQGLLMERSANIDLVATPQNSNGTAAIGATVTWTSSNNNIATVNSSGRVTGVANGTANITATVQRSSTTSDKFTFTIPLTVVTTGWTAWPASPQSILSGPANVITLSPIPAGSNLSMSWGNSNPAVAALAESTGTVTGLTAGSTTITAIYNRTDIPVSTIRRSITINVAAYTAVTSIDGVPKTAIARSPLSLTGTVVPANATNKTIVWTVHDAGGTGAVISGNTLTTTRTGTVIVLATIKDGATATTDYTQAFSIDVFAPVTSITEVPITTNAGTPLHLTATVNPDDASYSTIIWSIADAGETGATISGVILNTVSEGTVQVKATITNGVAEGHDYVQYFNILVTVSTAPEEP